MKYAFYFIIVVNLMGSVTNQTEVMNKHPLNHPEFHIQDAPISSWSDGWNYHTDVMEYLFKSEEERVLAISKLLEAGYGYGKKDYLFVSGKNISVNGVNFKSLEEARNYIRRENMKKVLYTDQTTFPKSIPDDIIMHGVEFWLIDWRK